MAHIQFVGLAELKSRDDKVWKFPYAIPIIISGLSNTDHTYETIDMHIDKLTTEEIIDRVADSDARLIGISAWSHNYATVKLMMQKIRQKKPETIVIVGGVLSGNADLLVNRCDVDIVVTGAEGELIVPEVLDALDSDDKWNKLSTIHDLYFKNRDTGDIVITEKRKLMSKEQFAERPFPAYEYYHDVLVEIGENFNNADHLPVKGFPLLTMRGCPFQCTFCGHLYGRKFLRKSWDKFFEEVDYLIDNYNATGFFSFDTNMFLNEIQVDEFCEIYKERGYTFQMCAELRPTFGDKEMFQKLYDCGIRVALFGFESGSQYMLERMKKGFIMPQMRQVIKDAADTGLMFHGNFIFGTPGENVHTIKETRKFMIEMQNWIEVQTREMAEKGIKCTSGYGRTILIPSPTSELYELALKEGLLKDEEDYLISLDSEETKKILKGSNFKIALAHVGGDVNMSEFSSKDALVNYVEYTFEYVQLNVLLFGERSLAKNIKTVLPTAGRMLSAYYKYFRAIVKDKIAGRKGFFDPEATAKYKKVAEERIDKYLSRHNV